MGNRGPIPKREKQRRRRNKPDGTVDKGVGAAEVPIPPAKSTWHPAAKRWYESLERSGQSYWYEPSDWATAYVIAESMSRDLKPVVIGFNEKTGKVHKESMPINGARLSSYLKAMSVLLVTEGDRRRARIELERPAPGDGGEEGPGNVSWLDQARRSRESS